MEDPGAPPESYRARTPPPAPRRLTHLQAHRLMSWLEGPARMMVLNNRWDIGRTAQEATRVLRFEVGPSSVAQCCRDLGLVWGTGLAGAPAPVVFPPVEAPAGSPAAASVLTVLEDITRGQRQLTDDVAARLRTIDDRLDASETTLAEMLGILHRFFGRDEPEGQPSSEEVPPP